MRLANEALSSKGLQSSYLKSALDDLFELTNIDRTRQWSFSCDLISNVDCRAFADLGRHHADGGQLLSNQLHVIEHGIDPWQRCTIWHKLTSLPWPWIRSSGARGKQVGEHFGGASQGWANRRWWLAARAARSPALRMVMFEQSPSVAV
jgi:hypothetical protein